MAQLVVRNLSDATKQRLKRRAKRHGRSLEAEVRDILTKASEDVARTDPSEKGLGTLIAESLSKIPLPLGVWEEFDKGLREERERRLALPPKQGLFDE